MTAMNPSPPANPSDASGGMGVVTATAADPRSAPGGGATDVIRVPGPGRLAGEVHVTGAKNAALKLMAAALLAPGRTVIGNVPRITDIAIMAEVLRRLGCDVRTAEPGGVAEGTGSELVIDVPTEPGTETDYDLVRRLRASICVLGPLLARRGRVRVALPGGDAIGSRGLDWHVAGLTRMGAEFSGEHGLLEATAPDGLTGAKVWLDFPSVGATENLLMASVLAKGVTEIDNAAREPEIVDICAMLAAMGARISGAGTSRLEIEGVPELRPVTHQTIGDRIVGGTWALAAAMTRGDVTVHGVDPGFLEIALDKVATSGATVQGQGSGFRVVMERRPRGVDVVTLPFPGFATDLLPMALGLAAVSDGASLITENIFDGRFMFVQELARLGADIRTDGKHAVVRGRERLSGAPVRATDIRAGAGLVIAALCADGVTEVSNVHHIDRGYPDFVADLRRLGVTVEREAAPPEPTFNL
jgi:UDP-N-acetylglucosamine 1-carboxyvinyltransferase